MTNKIKQLLKISIWILIIQFFVSCGVTNSVNQNQDNYTSNDSSKFERNQIFTSSEITLLVSVESLVSKI